MHALKQYIYMYFYPVFNISEVSLSKSSHKKISSILQLAQNHVKHDHLANVIQEICVMQNGWFFKITSHISQKSVWVWQIDVQLQLYQLRKLYTPTILGLHVITLWSSRNTGKEIYIFFMDVFLRL